jgi:hypothetical protein
MTTATGISIHAASRLMPVNAVITDAPPSSSMAVTTTFVVMAKTKNTLWAESPQRALTTSKIVCALGARILTLDAITAYAKMGTAAPAAYQNGPDSHSLGALVAAVEVATETCLIHRAAKPHCNLNRNRM